MANNLLTPILEGGIRSTNFFNGRLLSGEDLSQEQSANRDARRQLGKALGDGVAYGLEVITSSQGTATEPIISVSPGLAVNRKGQTLTLPVKTDISLVRSLDSSDSEEKTFVDCRPTNPDVYVAGPGAYVLLICPAKGSGGRAPMSGLGNTPASCNTKYLVDGVQFRLIKLDISDQDLSDTSRVRNRLAYMCFGVTDVESQYLTDPFGDPESSYGLLDGLRPKVLTDCDVPLALLYWTSTDGVVFVDEWAVRRRITPVGGDGGLLSLASARRRSEGEAMLLQFQNQIEDIYANESNLETISAAQRFEYLCPVGMLPIGGIKQFGGHTASKGFDYSTFFGNNVCNGPVAIEGAQLPSLIRDSLCHPPIEVGSEELVWLYYVRENRQSIDSSTGKLPQAYLVFASGHIPNRRARFDLNRWDYSNYA